MREPAGDEDGKFNVRGYWLHLLEGHNEALRERAQAELDKQPEAPESLGYLWRRWAELDGSRRIGMNGPEGITYLEIESYSRLTGFEPTPDEVAALMLIDRVVLNPGKRDNGRL